MNFNEIITGLEKIATNPNEPTDLAEKIKFRRNKLFSAGEELKLQFVGLDPIIDEVIQNIENWYVMPELNTRPVIVCLWGMTGVGKTDLVRKLVKAIGFGDKFMEIQMSTGQSDYNDSIKDRLDASNISREAPGIVLFDEIQRWRTVDSDGSSIENNVFQDLWMLLSDGKFDSKVMRASIFDLAYGEPSHWIPDEYEDGLGPSNSDGNIIKNKNGKKLKRKKIYNYSYRDASRIKKLLKLKEPITEVMKWSDEKKWEVVISKINSQDIYDGDDYSNLLIFISGNLDEAYSMSYSVNDMDIDADVLHAFSRQINFLTIKNALKSRFKPEQISRFGNIHVIYPSMSRASYETLIRNKLGSLSSLIRSRHDISVSFDESVCKFIYRNGVIPSQGVRPVFSTIGAYIENAMPKILVRAIEKKVDTISVSHLNEYLIGRVGDESVLVQAVGKADCIKKDSNTDKQSIVSVHEAGHALVYAIKFGVVPIQIESNTTNEFNEGYTAIHNIRYTKKTVIDYIAGIMAGRVAEELVFGLDNCSTGASKDIVCATAYAAKYIRDWGFGDYNSFLRNQHKQLSEEANSKEYKAVNEEIESLVTHGKKIAEVVIRENITLYKELVRILLEEQRISQGDFKEILRKYGIKVNIIDPDKTLYHDYSSAINNLMSDDFVFNDIKI